MWLNKAANSTARIWSVFSGTQGELLDAGTFNISIYPANSDTPTVAADTSMTRLGTGLYYYAFNVSALANGNYTAHFDYFSNGTYYGNVENITVGTANVQADFERASNTTARIWMSYAGTVGQIIDTGTASIIIYPANSNTPTLSSTVMTRFGTGMYYYPWNITTVADGNYTAVFNALDGTNNYGGIMPITVGTGTYTLGVPPTTIGTIAFENGTSGTHGYLKWSLLPSNPLGFNIYRATDPFNNYTKIDAVAGNVGTYTDGTVNNQTHYKYFVMGTNLAGASLPSPFVDGFIYLDQFNWFYDTLDGLKSLLLNNVNGLRQVDIGERDVFPGQMPYIQLIPQTNEEDDFITTGKVEYNFNVTIRVYDVNFGKDRNMSVQGISVVDGRVRSVLEANKRYVPYWYNSDVDIITYGETAKGDSVRKYADIKFIAKRRENRN